MHTWSHFGTQFHTAGSDREKMNDVKQVLISYSDQKKVLKITPNLGLTDVEVLTKSFRTKFKFEMNVNMVVTFLRFDPQ